MLESRSFVRRTSPDDEVAATLRAERLASLTVTPLVADGVRLGILVCFFARRTEFDSSFFDLLDALGRQASQTLTRVRLQRRLAFLALHDQLTGVANRQLLELDAPRLRAGEAPAASWSTTGNVVAIAPRADEHPAVARRTRTTDASERPLWQTVAIRLP